LQKAHILLVDDEKEFADVMKERLELTGYTVTTCYNAEKALRKVQAEEYDVAYRSYYDGYRRDYRYAQNKGNQASYGMHFSVGPGQTADGC
jgi:PleD family two-component response regulator